jgi:hypothetical protein
MYSPDQYSLEETYKDTRASAQHARVAARALAPKLV